MSITSKMQNVEMFSRLFVFFGNFMIINFVCIQRIIRVNEENENVWRYECYNKISGVVLKMCLAKKKFK